MSQTQEVSHGHHRDLPLRRSGRGDSASGPLPHVSFWQRLLHKRPFAAFNVLGVTFSGASIARSLPSARTRCRSRRHVAHDWVVHEGVAPIAESAR